jgi:predicted nucleic acid-binding protein
MIYTKDKIFIDTNVLVYTQNDKEREKQLICRKTLSFLIEKNLLVISTQVMQEYYNVATQKMRLEKLYVKRTIEMFDVYETITIKPSIIFQAIDIHILHQLSFWDSLIISAAKSANCTMVLTEDMNDSQVIEGVKIQNPFTFQM